MKKTLADGMFEALRLKPRRWTVTGAAGFIGSHLVETLLRLDQFVVGMDNFSTGYQHNLEEVRKSVKPGQWQRFSFIHGDIRNPGDCTRCVSGSDYVLHQAAIGSVPWSLDDPAFSNDNNISGFLNMLLAARNANVRNFVYAASSSTYGDLPGLPKKEDMVGVPLSPYAVTKYVNELYAEVFNTCYGFPCIGLRYFNVFGPRQDPNGAYAAVIPRWFATILEGRCPEIYGDGETTRDFCYIANTVQANILAAITENPAAKGQVFNVALGEKTSLNQLFGHIRDIVARRKPEVASMEPVYRQFRPGDIRHSVADVSKACELLGYCPSTSVDQGLAYASQWYMSQTPQPVAS
ncbi:SDR family oxidoreductase [Desulfovibrio oxyclinae]|uniref:SDR family oxidoreductase n=1 Tax=Desulfovibrio oxyclinae TaxID=63560 RepID=UPI00037ADE09|nr:SDR family oxidoreductase [Desulfovibrio oxyclinae]